MAEKIVIIVEVMGMQCSQCGAPVIAIGLKVMCGCFEMTLGAEAGVSQQWPMQWQIQTDDQEELPGMNER